MKDEDTERKRRASKRSSKDKDKKDHSKKAKSSKEKETKEQKAVDRMKHEMEEMKKKIDELTKLTEQTETKKEENDFALGFDKNEYLEMGFINSAIWITNVVAANMKERMKENEERWKILQQLKPAFTAGTPCATFNRGEPCNLGKWHSAPRKLHIKARLAEPFSHQPRSLAIQSSREELRIHACTLCMKALGIASGHPVLDCPWILEKNWI